MPEGHTIHRLARDLNRDLKGHPVQASSPQGRFRDGARLIDGQPLERAEAWGKNLFLTFDTNEIVYVHLGLIGKFRRHALPAPAARGAIRLRLAGPEAGWDLTGPNACKLVTRAEKLRTVNKLGPDPLRRGTTPETFEAKAARSSRPIGAVLLDQATIAGVGNVYRSEFCFLAGVHPMTAANELADGTSRILWDLSVEHLKEGVRLNRIVTREPKEVGMTRGRIPPRHRLYVYKRHHQPCHRCGTPIEQGEVAARTAWWCPRCQPR
ncbi:MAG: Fpg/Nei family DNA glycosylase [Acidimicrobiales bacterium]|nr:Fpg/Nei family DNA glycosylase [Acidimicrobiales bacterium]